MTRPAVDQDDDENIDETYGINVQFQESDDDADEVAEAGVRRGYGDEVEGSDGEGGGSDDDMEGGGGEGGEDGDEDGEAGGRGRGIKGGLESKSRKERKDKDKLHPIDIDAHWLQRKLSKYFDDATVSQEKSQDVLQVRTFLWPFDPRLFILTHFLFQILRNSGSDRECENHLVLLLGYDCFDFIKILLKNRDMVSYCISLKSAQSDKEREKIFIEMRQEPHLKAILKQLEGDDDEGGSEDEDSNKRNGHASQQVLATTQYIFCGSVFSIKSI